MTKSEQRAPCPICKYESIAVNPTSGTLRRHNPGSRWSNNFQPRCPGSGMVPEENRRMDGINHRCLASCYINETDLKRCQLPVDHYDPTWNWHLFVSATDDQGVALVVRWRDHEKQPAEILIARKE